MKIKNDADSLMSSLSLFCLIYKKRDRKKGQGSCSFTSLFTPRGGGLTAPPLDGEKDNEEQNPKPNKKSAMKKRKMRNVLNSVFSVVG